MAERLFGLETEYGFSVLGADGRAVSRGAALEALVQIARARLPSLPGARSAGLFLANGARLYVDAGMHPELATPECASPGDVVRYAMAGDRILERLARDLVAQHRGVAEVVLTRCNVDYSGLSGATWGCHESYLHRTDPNVLAREIVPHLVSRIVYAGAGGFDSLSNDVAFTLSPRVAHLTTERSSSSTHDRGIFHNKDESLSGAGFHRLHVICGESSCSRLAAWLKVGTTALIVAMIDAGLFPGSAVKPGQPLRAMQRFARDPLCRVEAPLRDGTTSSALGIQRRYLAQAEEHAGAAFMPRWADDVCRAWRTTLDDLARGPRAVETKLDWAIKLALLRRHVARRGFDWEAIERWTPIVRKLTRAIAASRFAGTHITVEELLDRRRSPVPEAVEQLTAEVAKAGLAWSGLRPLVDLKKELCEIDTRYSQLGERGIFSGLAHAGLLDDAVPGVEDVDAAVAEPPGVGRAKLRGAAIRRLSGRADCSAEWQRVFDASGRSLDLRDPFAESEIWGPCEIPRRGGPC